MVAVKEKEFAVPKENATKMSVPRNVNFTTELIG